MKRKRAQGEDTTQDPNPAPLKQPRLSTDNIPKGAFEIIHPCTDFGFKRAFYQKNFLIGFLNNLWKLTDENQVEDITYLDQELQSRDPVGRNFTVDIRCKTKKGDHYLIEMQNDYRGDYANKAFLEHCRLIGHLDSEKTSELTEEKRKSLRAGSTFKNVKKIWQDVKAVRTIVITNKEQNQQYMKANFPYEKEAGPEIVNTYGMRHERYPDRHLGNIDATVTLIMLSNFNKEEELETDEDRWLYALKDKRLATGTTRIPTFKEIKSFQNVAGENEHLKNLYINLNKNNIGRDQLKEYESGMLEVEEILDKERQEGIEQGKKEAFISVAQNMISSQLTNTQIANFIKTKEGQKIFTEEEIESLRQEMSEKK